MTSTELYNAHDACVYPVVGTLGEPPPLYVVQQSDDTPAWLLTETEAALLVARLLAMLPARMGSIAIELSEIIVTDRDGQGEE